MLDEETMKVLNGCIRFHKMLLKTQRVYMSLSTVAIEEATLKFLIEYKAKEEKR